MRFDIVIPARNEERRIDPTLAAYRRDITSPEVRFIVALDDCTDGTEEVVKRHADADPRVEIHHFPQLGKGGVIIEAFRQSRAELVGFVDADCATPPAEMLRLAAAASTADGAIACRRHPASVLPARRPPVRRIESTIFAYGIKTLFGLPYSDTQCGAKVLRGEVVDRILPFLSSRDLLFDVDLLLTARRLGYQVVEVPTVWIDQPGSKIHAGSDAGKMVASSLRLWFHHRVLPFPAVLSADDRIGGRGPERAVEVGVALDRSREQVVIDLRDEEATWSPVRASA